MVSKRLIFSTIVLFFMVSIVSKAQDTITREDYDRALRFSQDSISEKVFNLSVIPRWLDDNSGFWYRSNSRDGRRFYVVNFDSRTSSPAFDHESIAEQLNDKFDMEAGAGDLPFNQIEFVGEDSIQCTIKKKHYLIETQTQTLSLIGPIEKPEDTKFQSTSPDGKWIAFAKEYNLLIKSTETDEEIQLSQNGKKNYEYASSYGWANIIEGENGERPQNFFVRWSPDSKKILTQICDLGNASKMYLLDWSVDTLYRPRLLSYYRGSPGDTNVVYHIPVIFDIENRWRIQT